MDYLGLLQKFGNGRSDTSEASAVSDALKDLAQRSQIAVVAMQQPNRNRENRTSKRPVATDLRDSNKIVQDAHRILFIHRPHAHKPSEPSNLVEVHVLKDRDGEAPRIVKLAWSPSTFQYIPWDEAKHVRQHDDERRSPDDAAEKFRGGTGLGMEEIPI